MLGDLLIIIEIPAFVWGATNYFPVVLGGLLLWGILFLSVAAWWLFLVGKRVFIKLNSVRKFQKVK
jgi:hypothetical protein